MQDSKSTSVSNTRLCQAGSLFSILYGQVSFNFDFLGVILSLHECEFDITGLGNIQTTHTWNTEIQREIR